MLILPPFRRAADCRVNRTVKIGYDVCSACYRECSRQPIRVILRESSHAKSGYPEEDEDEEEEEKEEAEEEEEEEKGAQAAHTTVLFLTDARDHANASE